MDWLVRFYAGTGKRPLRLSRELPGFVGNRLQEALWREALHMVAAGEATVEEIDASIAFGPGLRWALMGPCLTFHLAGGGGGMAHMLDHFGAALEEPWTRLQAPPLTPELRDRMIEGCLREADGRSVAELERLRDGFLADCSLAPSRTDPAAVDWLVRFYAGTGKRPLRLSRELPGFVGNRLQEALWREALHMVAAGEATVAEIDASIAFGPGLRWALMGPCLTFHLAGGGGGMAHMLDHFGAALEEPWTRLQAPPLTPELRDRMIEGCLREADGRSVAELERLRDGFLADLLELVERYAVGDGVEPAMPVVAAGPTPAALG